MCTRDPIMAEYHQVNFNLIKTKHSYALDKLLHRTVFAACTRRKKKALPCQRPFCQTAPLLSSVVRQQNLTEYWREGSTSTAISPTSASDVVGPHTKLGVLKFGATVVIIAKVGNPPPPSLK
jgi:hypothetical protein